MKFRVELVAYANMSQVAEIEADSEDEAESIAINTCGDRVWKYDGIDQDSIVALIPRISQG